MQLDRYVELLESARPILANESVQGLCGRIIRGKKSEDFLTLTDDPTRKIVMLVDPNGLSDLLGKSGYEMLITIGYDPEYIKHKVAEGNQFKLVVFPEGGAAKLATWDDTLGMVCDIYPHFAEDIERHSAALKMSTFADIQAQIPYRLLDVEKLGKADERFMTEERFLKSARRLVDLRAFLYFSIHLRELYRGDGYTYDANGTRGVREYIIPNRPLTELGDHRIVNINVQVSPSPNTKGTSPMVSKKASKLELPIPDFFNESRMKADKVWRVPYQERADQAEAWSSQHRVQPAAKDGYRICLMPIDCQNTFCLPDFELFVGGRSGTGAIDDNVRLCEFIYRNLGVITEIDPTMDTHTAMQIFHNVFFVNDDGKHPAPMTPISLDDLKRGIWKVNPGVAHNLGNYTALQQHVLHYARKLSDGGKYALMIWPYHAMLGGIGHALVATVEEACFFHNLARRSQTGFEIKGGNPLTENYSVLRPEVMDGSAGQPIAQKNARFIEKLFKFDAVVIGGQAKSHCVAWTIADLLTEIQAKDEKLAKKVYLLEDCTSSVFVPKSVTGLPHDIDFTGDADKAFQKFADAGMHVVRSTDPIESWPGITL